MAKPSAGSTLNTGHALATSLEACWAFLEGSGTAVEDLTGNGHDLTLDGTATSWTTVSGEAAVAKTDNTNRGSTLASNVTLSMSSDWSVAFRAALTTDNANGVVLGNNADTDQYIFLNGTSNVVRIRANGGTAIDFTQTLTTAYVNCVMTFNAATSEILLYVDGSANASNPKTDSGTSIVVNSVLGGISTANNLVGTMLYCYIWLGRILTSTEAGDLNADPYAFLTPAATDSVTVTYNRIIGRNPSSGPLNLSGSYDGVGASKVQAKLFLAADDSTVIDWTDVDTSLAGGTWTGSLTVSTGGPYYCLARLVDGSDNVLATSSSGGSIVCGDVFLYIGQSSTGGRGTSNQTYTGSGVGWTVNEAGSIVANFADPISNTASSAGSYGTLLASLISTHLGGSVPIVFVVNGPGGTGLFGSVWDASSGTTFDVTETQISDLSLNAIKAAIWLQGERDVGISVSQANYTAAEQELAAAINAFAGSPVLISTLCGHQSAETATDIDNIRKAKIASWDGGQTEYGANPIDIDLSDGGGDGLHYKTNAELAELAGRVWLAVHDAIYSGTNGRGPRLSTSGYEGDTIRLVFNRDLESGDTVYTSTAFSATDNASPVTISSVTKSGARTVDIVCSAPLTGPVTVTYGSGNTAAGATVPRTANISLPATINSISAVKLPAEPIYAVAVASGFPATASPGIDIINLIEDDGTMFSSAKFVAITKSDSVEIPEYSGRKIRAVYVGGAGDVVATGLDGVDVTFTEVPAGSLLPIRPKFIKNATTATLIIGLY